MAPPAKAAAPDPYRAGDALTALGLRPGEGVRFRGPSGGRWRDAKVIGVERDGSLALRDAKGAARSIPVERVEVQVEGTRGARHWVALADRLAEDTQLRLLP